MEQFSLQNYLDDLKTLCAIDSGKFNAAGTEAVADFFESRYQALGFKTERRFYGSNDFAPMLLVRNSDEDDIDVLFVSHMDTVFPVGTAAEWPLTVDENGIAHGPGCVDCKGGCLSIYYLLREMQARGELNFRFCVAMNSDEEPGSHYSRAYFEELAQKSAYCLVFEPGRPNDEYVGTRKGGAKYILKCHGIAAHSGVDPEKGASAILELSRWVNELYKLTDYEAGTTLNVGRFDGGGDNGAVPDYAECTLSMRYLAPAALEKLEALFERMHAEPFDSRTSMEIVENGMRPAMVPHEKTQALFEKLRIAGEKTGTTTELLVTGGGSDGNWISQFGVATLDGCGPCGGSLHTRSEYLKTWTIEPRLDAMRQLLLELF